MSMSGRWRDGPFCGASRRVALALTGLMLSSCAPFNAVGHGLASAGRAVFGPSSGQASSELRAIGSEGPTEVAIDGRVFVSTNDEANVVLDQPIRGGRRYWEVRLRCGPIMTGVTREPTVSRHWGGYGEENAGVYTWYPVAWPKAAEGDVGAWKTQNAAKADEVNHFGLPTTGDVFGFALDADARTLRVFWNGLEGPPRKLTFSGPYYPHAGVQAAANLPGGQPCKDDAGSGEFLTSRATARYAPPPGYRFLEN